MNRKERRAAGRRDRHAPATTARTVDELAAEARHEFDQGRFTNARKMVQEILARAPSHVDCLNLAGLIEQSAGRHTAAVRLLKQAVEADPHNAASHYNIGLSYQSLDKRDDAAAHFRDAIALGLSGQDVSHFIVQNPALVECLARIDAAWPARLTLERLLGGPGLGAVSGDVFLRCALETTRARGVALETFLTALRYALLQVAIRRAPGFDETPEELTGLCASLAQQCFINEYVCALGADEERQAADLRDLLQDALATGGMVPPFLVAIVAAYSPLHTLRGADALLERTWPDAIEGLVRQQVREPREEARDRASIAAITPIGDGVSALVRQHYEEHPYPRWTILPRPAHPPDPNDTSGPAEILVAGCGTGKHPLMTAQAHPNARILAVDISLASLAYARRKTREADVRTIEYAHADILQLGTFDRRFDLIESIGVLHHLADPKQGWRVLLSLLRPGGTMVVGLYSAAARRCFNEARAFARERGHRATVADIRAFRQDIIRHRSGWQQEVTLAGDFYAMSECRDLLFHAMEHQFTIADIKAFLAEEGLSFLGFELDDAAIAKFDERFPCADAATDLDCWEAFEADNPQTFIKMYVFHVRKAQ